MKNKNKKTFFNKKKYVYIIETLKILWIYENKSFEINEITHNVLSR